MERQTVVHGLEDSIFSECQFSPNWPMDLTKYRNRQADSKIYMVRIQNKQNNFKKEKTENS